MTNKNKVAVEQQPYSLSIVGRNVAVTESMKAYAREKIAKIEHLAHRIIDIAVTMDIVKLDHRVDIIMSVDHTKIKVSAVSTDMYASIDKACDRLQAKLRKYRSRIHEHHAKGLAVVDMNVQIIQRPSDDLSELNDAIVEENLQRIEEQLKPHEIVSRESRPLKTLNWSEAIMKMELSGDHFMIFRNEADQKLKVIYRRNDENYGIIEPE